MNMVDLYVAEVGQHLPEKERADIETEIRSLIQDTLEARSEESGRPVDEAMIVEVLKEFGPPQKMAASYTTPRYLIGPQLFPTFVMVLKIVLAVITVIAVVRLGLAAGQVTSLDSFINILAQYFAELFTSALTAFGNVVIVFAILEWVLPKTQKSAEWNPRKMKQRQPEDRVSPVSQAVEIAFTVAALVVFNFYPQWIGLATERAGEWVFYPVLTDTFFSYLPFWNIIWALEIALSVFLLSSGRWTSATRWMNIGLKVFSIAILGIMVAGAPIVQVDLSLFPDASRIPDIETALYTGVRSVLVLIAFLQGVDIFKDLYHLLIRRSAAPITA